jgi:hypothetical protein
LSRVVKAMNKPKPSTTKARRRNTKPPPGSAASEGNVKHVLRTGLPPGIEVDEAIDPGAHGPRGPTDDRS